MNKSLSLLLAGCLLTPGLCVISVSAQQKKKRGVERWETAIQKFEAADKENPPKPGGVLFVGSSSIRMWDTDKWFPDAGIINRGFGGSQISDVNHYAERIVLKHKPKTIFFYAGDNDVAVGKSAQRVFEDYQKFLGMVAAELPETHVVFIPIKPSIKRWSMWPTMSNANDMIRRLSHTRHNWHYVDIATPMLDKAGKVRDDIFIEDGLHLNAAGYKIWTGLVAPMIAKLQVIQSQEAARGVVFHDENGNGKRDEKEKPLSGIRVSNGRDIVMSDANGRYAVPVDKDDIVFVIKPRNWRTPLSDHKLPRFYYIHKPAGSPKQKYPGVAPTGDLPKSVDFPLYPQDEPEKFQAIMFGDPQPRDQKEVDYVAHDVVEELIGTKASFGVTLGDIMFDNLSLFEAQNKAIALLGIPWYNVIGNHDINTDATHDHLSDETFESVFGPSYYSFDHGPVHFIVVDDIMWLVEQKGQKGRYVGGLGKEQMEFLRNDLARIPEKQLVVLMMHIPLENVQDRQELYRLIEKRPFSMSISGHTHHHEHRFITKKDGWLGKEPHHHVINVTVSGSWWSGSPDERGIPHTMMADGAPNGYSIISFDGHEYKVDFKAAGRSADYQMNIQAPEVVASGKSGETDVYANVFNGSEKSKVVMSLSKGGPWIEMKRKVMNDPLFKKLSETENAVPNKTYRNLPNPKASPHLWHAKLPKDVKPGVHLLHVRETDRHGRVHTGHRVLRVTK